MKRSLPAITAALALATAASVAFAGDEVTSLSYISYLERYATLHPAQTGETLDVVVNMPVLAGDRLSTSRGARVEVQLADGSTVWVDEFSTLDFDALALSRDDSSARTALYLAEGTAAVEIPAIAAGDGILRLDSPAGTIFLNRPGLYRLELRGDEIRVQAFAGLAELPLGVGSAILRGGEEATVSGSGEFAKAGISDRTDDFWNWVQERRNPPPAGRTAQYVDTRAAGRTAVLDSYGDWVYVDTFSSWMWRPRVSLGWVPYSYGRWYWTPIGWNWISYEPWGWYPFHYGSWYFDVGFGWVWGWDSIWSPAWVHWIYTPGYVGWCPRGYYDWWYFHNCSHCWGDKWMHPGRWSEAAFDFSGRVRLADVDPRPWTIVPAGQFGNTHLERVRLEPGRFLRDLPGDRTGFVRSGPMVTTVPNRGIPDRGVESFFRLGAGEREVPDLSSVLHREPIPGSRTGTGTPNLRLSRTGDLGIGQGAQGSGLPGPGSRSTGSERWYRGEGAGRRTGVVTPGSREGQGGQGNQGTSTPPTVERRPVGRPHTEGTRSNPPRDAVRPPSRNVEPKRDSVPPPERPAPPPPKPERPQAQPAERPQAQPAERPPARQVERTQSRGDATERVRERAPSRPQPVRQSWSDRSAAGTWRREVAVRSRAAEPGGQPRSFEGQRVAATSGSYRIATVSHAPVVAARSAPSSAQAPRGVSSGSHSARSAPVHTGGGSGRPRNR